jgi:hypothetical protein
MHRLATVFALGAVLAGCGAQDPERETAQPVAPITEPRALQSIDGERDAVLAGDVALAGAIRGRVLTIRALPLDGATPATDALEFEAQEGAEPGYLLDASSERAAIVVSSEGDRSRAVQAFAGPPRGPWEPLGPLRAPQGDEFAPGWHDVDGATLFTTEFRGDYRKVRTIVREPGAAPREVDLPMAFPLAFAGDFVAYGVPVKGQPEDDEPRRLVLRNWRTGERRASTIVREGIEELDVRPDGRVVVNDDGGGLLELRDGALRRLTRTGVQPAYAGDRIVFVRQGEREGDEGLAVVEPDGRVRPFGVRTARLEGFDVDGSRVLWRANGCLLVADLTAAAAPAPSAGPCPRSELFMDDIDQPAVGRSRRVPLTLRCVAAPPPGCRGRVRVELVDEGPRGHDSTAVRFRIPSGRTRRLAPRLTRAAYRAAARQARHGPGGVLLSVDAVAVDPEGRRSRISDGYGILIPRRASP